MLELIIAAILFVFLFPLRRHVFGKGKWIITIPILLLISTGGLIGYFLATKSVVPEKNAFIIVILGALVMLVEGLPVLLGWIASIFNFYRNFKNDRSDN